MLLIVDGDIVATGAKEHCMYENNMMTLKERETMQDITINYDDGEIALVIKKEGVEQIALLSDIKDR